MFDRLRAVPYQPDLRDDLPGFDFGDESYAVKIGVNRPQSAELNYAEKAAAKPILLQAKTVGLFGGVTNRWAERFLTLSNPASWKRFELHGNKLSDTLCKFLPESSLASLRCELLLDSNRVTDAGRQILRNAFGARFVEPRKPWDRVHE